MKKIFSKFTLYLLFPIPFNTFALSSTQFEGSDWRSATCSSYADSLLQGTYNYRFDGNGKIETYIEYYTDLSCKTKTGWIDYQTTGTYTIKESSKKENSYLYKIEVKLTHLNYPLFYNLIVKKDNMTLCKESRCWNYIRIK